MSGPRIRLKACLQQFQSIRYSDFVRRVLLGLGVGLEESVSPRNAKCELGLDVVLKAKAPRCIIVSSG